MPMNGELLGTEIIAAMNLVNVGIVEGDSQESIESKSQSYRSQLWKAIAGAIVLHIQTNAVVQSTVAVASVSGVTTGPGASGPGTGTASGTVT